MEDDRIPLPKDRNVKQIFSQRLIYVHRLSLVSISIMVVFQMTLQLHNIVKDNKAIFHTQRRAN